MYEKVPLNLTFFSSGTLFGIRIRDDYGPVRVYSAFSKFLFTFKGTVSRDFLLLVFLMQFPPQPQSIPIEPFQFFSKIRVDIRKSRCATGINDTVSNLPPVSTSPAANLSTSFTSVVDTGGKFASSVNNTGGKFATGVNNTGGKQREQLSNC
jgi:hypothetical protein